MTRTGRAILITPKTRYLTSSALNPKAVEPKLPTRCLLPFAGLTGTTAVRETGDVDLVFWTVLPFAPVAALAATVSLRFNGSVQ